MMNTTYFSFLASAYPDEIEAKVYRAAGLAPFKMTEDVDEIDSEGRETSSKREVVIDIEWTTTEAKILNSKKKI